MSSSSTSKQGQEKKKRRRRLRDMTLPLIAAGLLKFPEAKEYEKIKVDPKVLIIISIIFIVIVLALNFI
jgi:preprotein translocase subunit Sec61beta